MKVKPHVFQKRKAFYIIINTDWYTYARSYKSRKAHISFVIWYWRPSGKSPQKLKTWLKSDKNIGHFTWRPNYVYTVDSSTKHFVAQQQCKGDPLLHNGSAEQFYIVNSYMMVGQNTNGTYCCVSMAINVKWTCHWVKYMYTAFLVYVVHNLSPSSATAAARNGCPGQY